MVVDTVGGEPTTPTSMLENVPSVDLRVRR